MSIIDPIGPEIKLPIGPEDLLNEGADIVEGILSGILSALKAIVDEVIKPVAKAVGNLAGDVFDTVKPLVETSVAAVNLAKDKIIDEVELVSGEVFNVGQGLSRELANAVADTAVDIAITGTNVINAVSSQVGFVIGEIEKAFTAVGDKFVAGVTSIVTTVGSFVGDIASALFDGFTFLGTQLLDVLKAIVSGVDDAISFAADSVESVVGVLAAGIETIIGPLLETIGKTIADIPGAFIDVLGEGGKLIIEGVDAVISPAFRGAADALRPLAIPIETTDSLRFEVQEL